MDVASAEQTTDKPFGRMPEIDIMEYLICRNELRGSVHTTNNNGGSAPSNAIIDTMDPLSFIRTY